MLVFFVAPFLAAAQAAAGEVVAPPIAPVAEPARAASTALPSADPPLLLIAVDRELSSRTMRADEFFPIRLAAAVTVGNRVVLPAGLRGEGQVVHASRAKGLGKGGELIVAARYLQCGPTRIALRGFRLDGAGGDKTGVLVAANVAVGLIATPLMFMKGGEFVIPANTVGHAKLVEPLPLAERGAAVCAGDAEATSSINVPQQGVTK